MESLLLMNVIVWEIRGEAKAWDKQLKSKYRPTYIPKLDLLVLLCYLKEHCTVIFLETSISYLNFDSELLRSHLKNVAKSLFKTSYVAWIVFSTILLE